MKYRVEIISNQSVEDDIIELLEQEIPNIEYTLIPAVHGRGLSSKKLGNTIWPEQNFVLFTYLKKEEALKVKAAVKALKQKFEGEGISIFCSKGIKI